MLFRSELLKNGDFDGINVTIPYKKDVLPYLDEIDPLALRLGAVNTIVTRGGKLFGYNSDYYGFRSMVLRTRMTAQTSRRVSVSCSILRAQPFPKPPFWCWTRQPPRLTRAPSVTSSAAWIA